MFCECERRVNNQLTGDNTVFVVCRFRLWRWCRCCVCGWVSPSHSSSLDITLASVSRWLLELSMFLLLLIHLLLLSIVVCLTLNDYNTWLSWWYAHVTMILLWLTDYNDDLMSCVFYRWFFVCFNYSCHSVRMSCWIKTLLITHYYYCYIWVG